jgi:PAS domain S-box-containing protein
MKNNMTNEHRTPPANGLPSSGTLKSGGAASGKRLTLAYAVAVLGTLATLVLLETLTRQSITSTSPVVVLVVPIAVSACWGGLGPGLVSTLLATLLANYYILPPIFSMRISSHVDIERSITLLVAGVLISLLSEAMLRARSRAQEGEARLAGMIRSARYAVVAIDEQERVTLFNPAAESMFRINAAEILGQPLKGIIPQGLRVIQAGKIGTRGAQETDDAALTFGTVHGRRANGEEFPIEASMSQAEVGGHTLLTAIMHDITIRLRNQEMQSWLASIVESSHDAITAVTLEGVIKSWNAGAERLYGFTPKEAVGRSVEIIAPPELTHEIKEMLQEVAEERRVLVETVRMRKNQSRVDVAVVLSPIRNAEGKVIGASAIARDIGERKRLEEMRSRLAAIVESSDVAIESVNLEGMITSWNRGAEHLYGYSAKEVLGQHISIVVPPELLDDAQDTLQKFVKHDEVRRYEAVRLRKDGTRIIVSTTVSPLKNAEGRVFGASAVIFDVTERKRAEEAQARLAAIVESSDDAIVGTTLDGTITSWNAGAQRLYGYSPDEALGKPVFMIAARRVEEIKSAVEIVSAGGHVKHMEAVGIRKDGTKVDVSTTVSAIIDVEGRVIGASAIARDISDRKRAEEELYQSRQMLQLVLDHIPQRVFWKDRNFRYLGCNRRLLEDGGLSSVNDILGKTDFELPWKGYAALYRQEDNAVMDEGQLILGFEEPRTTPDGSVRWVSTNKVPLRDRQGTIIGILGTYEDITVRRRAAMALEASEKRYRRFVERNAAGVLLSTLDGRILDCNPSFARILGYESAEELKNHRTVEFYCDPSDRARLIHRIREEKVVNNYELSVRRKDGSTAWMLMNLVLVDEQGGEEEVVEGTFIDITERKEKEQQLVQSVREKEVLLKEIHHRVKNNLQVVSSLMDMQSRRIQDAHALSTLIESRNRVHVMALIHQKLYQSRDLAHVDFGEYLRSLANALAQSYNADPAAVHFRVETEPVHLGIDMAIPCALIFNELVSNCLKHAFPNGRYGQIVLGLSRHGERAVRLVVSDDGVGLPKDLNVQNTRSLGLQLVNDLTRQIGGTIDVHTDGGTVVQVEFVIANGQ